MAERPQSGRRRQPARRRSPSTKCDGHPSPDQFRGRNSQPVAADREAVAGASRRKNMDSRFRGNDSSKSDEPCGAARRGGRRVRETGRRGRRTGRRTSSRPLPRAPIERSGELPARCRLHERLKRGQARARRDEGRPRRPEAYCGQYVAGRRGGHSPGRLDGWPCLPIGFRWLRPCTPQALSAPRPIRPRAGSFRGSRRSSFRPRAPSRSACGRTPACRSRSA